MQQEKPKTQLGWREDAAVSMQDSLMASWSLGGGGHSSWKISHLECPGCVFFSCFLFFFFPPLVYYLILIRATGRTLGEVLTTKRARNG